MGQAKFGDDPREAGAPGQEEAIQTVFGSPSCEARQQILGQARFELFRKKQKRNNSIWDFC
jgi:hypothetical protein